MSQVIQLQVHCISVMSYLFACVQIEELQAQESQLRADAGQGDDQIPAVHALLSQLALASPEETEQALAELLHAAADSRCSCSCSRQHAQQAYISYKVLKAQCNL